MTAETHWQRKITPPNSTDIIDVSSQEGDADNRYTRDAAGKQEWGNGTDAVDVVLERASAGVLGVTGGMSVSTTLAVTGAASFAGLVSLAAGLALSVTTATCATTGTAIVNRGLTILTSTTTKTYSLAAPVAGIVKAIICTASGTSVKTVKSPAGVTVDGTNDDLTFNAANEAVILIGCSSTRWGVISNVNAVGLS